MSTAELAAEKVRALPEKQARKILHLVDEMKKTPEPASPPITRENVLGFAARLRGEPPMTTAEWMKILREGDEH